ncbi:Penicillin amidase [Sandaracinus amylolyticus]|uniref:Penicillin amidase n=2 Tax=Sandaracinus amylolyticus TaxID=927083 RepID=A0A0F6WAG4_9BACT|nr:Penicillin amidase [Sandaracinus amylolyticus]
MPRMTYRFRLLLLSLASLPLLAACGDDDDAPPTTDGGTDAGMMTTTDLALPGLDGEVEVVYDDRGIPHIYGTTRHDVLVVQGYLMSRDRFAQMEFIRRSVLGRIAEIAGEDSLEDDVISRWEGYRRMGVEIYESLPTDDPARLSAEAFVEGINLYIDAVMRREEDPAVMGADVINLVIFGSSFGHWEPADIFALARFQSANLSFDPRDDLNRSARLALIQQAFPADDADPRIAARSGLFEDLFTQRPAREAFTDDGFPDGTTMALLPVIDPRPFGARFTPNVRAIRGAMPFLDRIEERQSRIFGDLVTRGSNNWTVSGEHTASGNPILSNDPHLSLISPAVWWYVHLNTARMGGEDMIDAQGTAFAGLPGVVIGFNRDIAWGVTTTGYDVTDAYQEQITGTCDADGNVTGGTVLWMGGQSPIAFHEETISLASGDPITVRFPYASHRPGSQFLPGSCVAVEGTTDRFVAVSVRYTGWEPSNELATFTGLMTATDVESGRAALDAFEVGSQNFMIVDRDDIMWSTQARIPVRSEMATNLVIDEETGEHTGYCPHMVVPGTGEYEWTGDLADTAIPHELAPARGWIATANQDNVGVTQDGNPCNDEHYVGAGFDYGWREARIQERLAELVERGDITTDDMIALQAETQSPLGRTLRDPIVAILGDTAAIEALGLTEDEETDLAAARTQLMEWTFETPHGVGATDTAEIADSVATTIFNAALTRIIPLALGDETERAMIGGPTSESARLIEWMLTSPSRLLSYDEAAMESVLWDDIRTDAVETKEEIVIRGVLAGLAFLTERMETSDWTEWRWGRLHTVRFNSVVPILGGDDVLSIPAENDPTYPNGFPRHGDWGNVDPGNFGLWNTESFSFGSGASQRLIVEMTADGPRAFNAIPGGQSIDPMSPHKQDEALLWIRNEQPPLYFTEQDVMSHAERELTVRPMD